MAKHPPLSERPPKTMTVQWLSSTCHWLLRFRAVLGGDRHHHQPVSPLLRPQVWTPPGSGWARARNRWESRTYFTGLFLPQLFYRQSSYECWVTFYIRTPVLQLSFQMPGSKLEASLVVVRIPTANKTQMASRKPF